MQHEIGQAAADLQGSAAARRAAQGYAGAKMRTRFDVECVGPDGQVKWRQTCYNRVVTVGLNKLLDATFKTGLTTPAWYVGICKPSILNGIISTGSNQLASTNAPWGSSDEGRAIIVRGAGAAGADLVTTISSASSAALIVLSTTALTSVAAAPVIWEARLGDTSTLHTPWTESTFYSNANRPTFTPGTIANGSVDNSGAVASFNINADNSLMGGLLIANSSVIASSTDLLYGMAPFTSPGFRQVNNGDTLNVTATLTAASA